MSLTLIPDLASELSNSYCTLAYASSFWTGDYRTSLATQWAALTSQQQTNLLIDACKVIETVRFVIQTTLPAYAMHYDYRTQKVLSLNLTRQPVRYYYYQRLQFPRNLDVYYMAVPNDVTPPPGYALGAIYIPEDIMVAQCLQAMYLLNFNEGMLADQLQGLNKTTTTLGKGEVIVDKEYKSGMVGSRMSPAALEYLRPYMVRNAGLQRA